jgi:hypothetical protein
MLVQVSSNQVMAEWTAGQQAAIADALGALEAFGDKHSIRVVNLADASAAADRIIRAEI